MSGLYLLVEVLYSSLEVSAKCMNESTLSSYCKVCHSIAGAHYKQAHTIICTFLSVYHYRLESSMFKSYKVVSIASGGVSFYLAIMYMNLYIIYIYV